MDLIFGKKLNEAEFMLDFDLIEESSRKVALKQVAIESVFSRIAHHVAMSDVNIKRRNERQENSLYYLLNVMPNKNQSKHEFLYSIVMKMLKDGECLVVKTDTNDLLIADNFDRTKKAVYGDVFKSVTVNDYMFERDFYREEVLYFKYSNNSLDKIMTSLYADYGELLGRMIEFQMKKSQLRATVNIDSTFSKDENAQGNLQNFINKVYSSVTGKSVAIIPQQKGLEYQEHSSETGNTESVDELKKVKNQFLHDVANAVGYPIAFLNGDIADIDKITKNYLRLTLDTFIKIIENEMNKQLFTSDEYLDGNRIEFNRIKMKDLFDLLGTGAISGNELREYVNISLADDPLLDEYFLSKDYKDIEGGDEE